MSFLDEVAAQGDALRNLVQFYREGGDRLLHIAGDMATRKPRSFVFTGMGTSEFVSALIQDYLSEKSDVPVIVREAGELLHFGLGSITNDDIIVAVSQSGESVETRMIVEVLSNHSKLIAVTNDPESTMARLARLNLPIQAGEETSISNKTYSNSMGAMLLLGRALVCEDYESVLVKLEEIATGMDNFFHTRKTEIECAAAFLKDTNFLYFISRGPALAAARQAALTWQEGARIPTTWMPGGSFRHGPFEMAGQGHHAIIFAPDGHGGDLLRDLALEISQLGSRAVLFTATDVDDQPNLMSIRLSPGDPTLFPLACAVPQELLLERMAADRGRTAGIFEHMAKITTRE